MQLKYKARQQWLIGMWPEIMLSELKHDIPIIIKQYLVAFSSTVANIKSRLLSNLLLIFPWFKTYEMKMLLIKKTVK